MVKALGIDVGSRTWGAALLEEERLVAAREMPSGKIRKNLAGIISLAEKADVIAVAGGYGLPVKKASALMEKDFQALTLKKKGEKSILGLSAVLREFARKKSNAFVLPGVKQLPTVPGWRKINKIDMGTPDKVAACACAVDAVAGQEGVAPGETSFLFAELGSFFNAFLAVEEGKIIDGLGGSCATMGWKARGAVDSELAYLMREKKDIYKGGLVDAKKVCRDAENAFWEGVLKDLARMRVSLDAKKVVLSGSLAGEAKKRLELMAGEYELFDLTQEWKGAKAAAVGAAMLANGIAGGEFRALFDCMKIGKAKGSATDFIA